MEEQRPGPTRRDVLRGVGGACAAGATGCVTAGGSAPVSVLAAGSLQNALSDFDPSVGAPVRVETHGSTTVTRLVREGKRDPDVVTVADPALFEGPLSPSWYSVFAGNAVVLAYDRDTAGGRRLERAGEEGWYRPILDGDVRVGRTDPDLDPLGYRTLFVLELASRYYDGAPDLRGLVPDAEGVRVYPETGLMSRFETGAVDAVFVYRNMAVERGYDYVELPDEIDLSDPRHADAYSTVSYELRGGRTVRGDVIRYASTVRNPTEAVLSVFAEGVTGDYLAEHGFVTDMEPVFEGEAPERVRRAVERAGAEATGREGGG